MKMKLKALSILMLTAVHVLLLISCATSGRTGPESAGEVSYWGYGTGSSMIEALNGAKKIALKDALVEMIGAPSAAANRLELDALFFQEGKAGHFAPGDKMTIITRSESEGMWRVEIMAVVDLFSVEQILRGNGIYGGKVAPGSEFGSGAVGARGTEAKKEAAFEAYMESEREEDEAEQAPEAGVSLTREEEDYIREYVEQMTYMVYFNEESSEDPFLMKSGAGIANKALAEESVYTIDLDQIETIKRDQEIAYEEETGRSISMIQWIAGKLNADVYIELDAVTSGETRGGEILRTGEYYPQSI